MSTDGLQPVLVDQYGGLCTLIDRSDLPIGLSPDCQNVEFFPGGVRSRNGFSTYLTTSSAATGLIQYINTAGVRRLLVLMTDGSIQVEYPETTLSNVPFGSVGSATTALGTGLIARGTTMFGRSFFCLSDGKRGVVGPFQYDGLKILTVGRYGPASNFTDGWTVGGTIPAGYLNVAVAFETSTGYVTGMPGVNSFLAPGSRALTLSNIPIGPGDVAKRIVFVSPTGNPALFTLPRFTINDNTTTTLDIDFTTAELMAGTSMEDFIDIVPLEPLLGVEKYGERLVYWGARGAIQPILDSYAPLGTLLDRLGFVALDFDGDSGVLPGPWVADGTFGAGYSITTEAGAPLQIYRVTGDGATATRGYIYQGRNNIGFSNLYYIRPQRKYGIRIRAKKGAVAPGAGATLECVLKLNGAPPVTIASFSSLVSSLSTEWTTYEAEATSIDTGASANLVRLELKVTGTLALNATVDVDYIEIYDVLERTSASLLRFTPVGDPETHRPTVDLMTVSEDDGQAIRDLFVLRGNLYILKEHSMYVTTDNGDDPVHWSVDQVSDTVGTPSVHGVAVCDGWAIIASRNGAFYFTGGAPEKISQEIQSTWDAINWTYGHLIWVAVDTAAKKVFFGVPYGASTTVDRVLVLDFVEGFGDPISGGGSGRKWTSWPLSFRTGAMIERDALTQTFLGASGTSIVKQVTGATSDWSGAFTSYYETAPVGTEIGRSLFDRVILRIRGAGTLTTSKRTPGGTLTALTAKTLSASPDDDVEIRMHDNQTQVGFRIGTTGASDYWSLRRLGVFIKPSAFTYLRKT